VPTRRPPPVLQALVLADHIYEDKRTGKKVIVGTFNRIWAKEFPSVLGRSTFAYLCLTDVDGTAELQLRYTDLTDHSVLTESTRAPISARDRLSSSEIIIEVPPLPMPHEGAYAFEAYVDDRLIGSLRITAGRPDEGRQ
jgi:hypothetical protein